MGSASRQHRSDSQRRIAGFAKGLGALGLVLALGSCATLSDGHPARSGDPTSPNDPSATATQGSEPSTASTTEPTAGDERAAVAAVAAEPAAPANPNPFEKARASLEAAIEVARSENAASGGRSSPVDTPASPAAGGEPARGGGSSQAADDLVARDLREAVEALTDISVEKLEGGGNGMLHQPFAAPIRLRVADGRGGPLADVPIAATVTSPDAEGRGVREVVNLRTDAGGFAELRLAAPVAVGRGEVTLALDLHGELSALGRLASRLAPAGRELVAQVERTARSKDVQVGYTVTSESAKVPTGILIVDVDGRNNYVWGDATTAGIVGALSPLEFHLVAVPTNPGLLGIDTPELLGLVRNNFAGQFPRVILGHAVLTGFESGAGGYSAGAVAKLEVADLASGRVLATATATGRASNASAIGAINGAFRAAGERAGLEIANRLP